jgi:myosin heavy subunit
VASAISGHHEGVPIEERVLATNPVLESFGNSKTARNNNSSRFGKWIQLSYCRINGTNGLRLSGARITQFLLEKSRVVIHSSEERNYHIFYQLCANSVMGLQPAANYRYLRYGKSLTVPGVDEKTSFDETLHSMGELGFTGKL